MSIDKPLYRRSAMKLSRATLRRLALASAVRRTWHDFVLEPLPRRILLSASVVQNQLIIEGSEGNDVIRIEEGSKPYKFKVTGVPGVADGTVFTLSPGGDISVSTGGGDDRIEIVISTYIDGPNINAGAGDDLVINTGGHTRFKSGPGADTIQGNGSYTALDFSDAPAGVEVRLDQGLVIDDGYGFQDVVTGAVQSVDGSRHDDVIHGGGPGVTGQYLHGDAGDDVMVGGDGVNTFFDAWHGDDTLTGGSGDDEFWAREGNDVIDGGAGTDKIAFRYITQTGIIVRLDLNEVQRDGTGGQDTVVNVENVDGSQRSDIIHGDANFNQINGNGGQDVIVQDGNGIDDTSNQEPPTPPSFENSRYFESGWGASLHITGVTGDDNIRIEWLGDGVGYNYSVTGGDVAVYGVSGVPDGFVFHDVRNVSVDAGKGDDVVRSVGNAGSVHLNGSTGDDTLSADGGESITFDGGKGDDTINALGGTAYLSFGSATHGILARLDQGKILDDGSGGEDTINGFVYGVNGTSFDDEIHGGTTGTIPSGGGHQQDLEGYNGNDLVIAADGIDTFLDGWYGDDTLIGGDGDDEFWARWGDDDIQGGAGTDKVSYTYQTDHGVIVRLDLGQTLDDGYGNTDALSSIEAVRGTGWDDLIVGTGSEQLDGGAAGDDTLIGDAADGGIPGIDADNDGDGENGGPGEGDGGSSGSGEEEEEVTGVIPPAEEAAPEAEDEGSAVWGGEEEDELSFENEAGVLL